MNTTSRTILGIIVLLVVIGLGYWFYSTPQPTPITTDSPQAVVSPTQQIPQPPAPAPPTQTPSPTPTPSPSPSSPKTVTITYADQGYSPSEVTIKKGDTVKWVNQGTEDMWTASGPHPAHTGYPTTGGCINSTFDSCTGIKSGSSWSFTFDVTGTWLYHNHSNPGQRGKVVVQ